MVPVSPSPAMAEIKEYAIWLISIIIVAFSFRYAGEMIAFVLEKLYQAFIQNPPG